MRKSVGIPCVFYCVLFFGMMSLASVHCSAPAGKQALPEATNDELFSKPDTVLPVRGRYIFKSVAELTSLIRNGEATCVDIVKEFIAHIRNNNYKYNAIVWLREKEALEEAGMADVLVATGAKLPPLLGIPVTVKEEFWVKGSPVTLNSASFKDFIAPEDGELVKQLKQAGAIIIGKTNVPALLMDFQTQGEIYPAGNNPYDTTKTPGGSSGGAAAALAAGFSTIELGSDLGGSIRLPASFCGLYGLKTTFGSLNVTSGAGPDTNSGRKRFALNVAGPIARTIDDLDLAWQVLRDAAPDLRFQQPVRWKKASGKTLSQYKIAWTDDWKRGGATVKTGAAVKEKLNRLIDSLKHHAVDVRRTAPDTYDEMMQSYFVCLALLAGEGLTEEARAAVIRSMEPWDDGTGTLDTFYTTMKDPGEAAWNRWQAENSKLKEIWSAFFNEYNFLICPVTYGPAFTKCKKGTPIIADGDTISYFNYAPYTTIFNPIGCPAVTVPLGLDSTGLPIAVQIIGPLFSEPELLYIAGLIAPLVDGFTRPKGI